MVNQSQAVRMPQVSASRCSSGLSKKQKVEAASTPTKTGSPAWKSSSRKKADVGWSRSRYVVLLVG